MNTAQNARHARKNPGAIGVGVSVKVNPFTLRIAQSEQHVNDFVETFGFEGVEARHG